MEIPSSLKSSLMMVSVNTFYAIRYNNMNSLNISAGLNLLLAHSVAMLMLLMFSPPWCNEVALVYLLNNL